MPDTPLLCPEKWHVHTNRNCLLIYIERVKYITGQRGGGGESVCVAEVSSSEVKFILRLAQVRVEQWKQIFWHFTGKGRSRPAVRFHHFLVAVWPTPLSKPTSGRQWTKTENLKTGPKKQILKWNWSKNKSWHKLIFWHKFLTQNIYLICGLLVGLLSEGVAVPPDERRLADEGVMAGDLRRDELISNIFEKKAILPFPINICWTSVISFLRIIIRPEKARPVWQEHRQCLNTTKGWIRSQKMNKLNLLATIQMQDDDERIQNLTKFEFARQNQKHSNLLGERGQTCSWKINAE